MAGSGALVDVLKRELKARRITYAQVARGLDVSEASVKRMFSRRNFTLGRVDAICRIAGIEFSELTRILNREGAEITQLTYEQEKQIIANKKLFLVAVCALNHVTFEQIVQELGKTHQLLILKKPFDPVEVNQLAGALTEKWNSAQRERARLEELRLAPALNALKFFI